MPALGEVAADVVALVGRMATILERSAVDADEGPGGVPAGRDALLDAFAGAAARVLTAVQTLDAAALRAPWTLRRGGAPAFTRPRGDVLRRLAVSPLVHFRGQLVLLLRRRGDVVPPFYAPWQLPVVIPPLPPEDAPDDGPPDDGPPAGAPPA